MKKITSLFVFFFILNTINAVPIGQWNAFLAYRNITDIEPAGNTIYVLSSNNLFSYNVNDHSINTYSKVFPLSDTGIRNIAWCNSANRLIIIYDNYNIDLLDNNQHVINVSGYMKASISQDKQINNINISGNNAYISTNFGIINLNVKKGEITDTYILNKKIERSIIKGNYIYAKTADNQLKANIHDNLLDPAIWTYSSDYVDYFNTNDIFYEYTDEYEHYYTYDNHNKCYWSNQKDNKLMAYTQDQDGKITIIAQDICPDSPKTNFFGAMKILNGKLYATCGGWSQMVDLNRQATIQVYDGNTWQIYQDDFSTPNQMFVSMRSIDVDPNNPQRVVVGGRSGINEFRNGQLYKRYSYDNSLLTHVNVIDNNFHNYVWVHSLMFDNNSHLWVLNSYGKESAILEMLPDETWVSHHNEQLEWDDNKTVYPHLANLMLDSRQLFWFGEDFMGGTLMFCYNPKTEQVDKYSEFINQDDKSLDVKYINDIKEDLEGNLWICTDCGPLMLTVEKIRNSNIIYTQPKVPRNDGTNYADYLLNNVDIKCVAVDGANRKWFGSKTNGIYLIGNDNIETIHHFTTENSQLLSDNIEAICINHNTGEVFIATDHGLCSFMGDATSQAETMERDNVYAYPNPVEPNFSGFVTIRGLTANADVKITTANGVLVHQGRSSGGTYSWNTNDLNGRPVASGVYMVHTATGEGKKGVVCRIAIVR